MRRRDATDHLSFSQRRAGWPALVCTSLSVGLHALLLAAATFVVLSGTRSTELIRVSLLPGGGGGAGPAAPAAPAEPAAAQPAMAQQLPSKPAPLHAQRPRARAALRVAPVARHPGVEIQELASLPTTEAAAPATDVGAGTVTDARSGSGGGGSGHGSGAGIGNGADQRAACLYCPEPRYPFIARARGWQGSVDVGLLVLADGTVDAASLRRSSGYGVLDEAAIAVARQSRFNPPAAQGLAAPLHGRIEYRFELTKAR
jgi:TonB family protein